MTVLVASGTPGTAGHAATPPAFGPPVTLPQSTGGEPSFAIDNNPASPWHGYMYVVSPNATANGPAVWASPNGTTWANPVQIDPSGELPGGDTDVAVQKNGNVIVTDLDLSHAWVQVSSDHAQTFNSGTPTAFEDDRPWITTKGLKTVYVAYHDFVLEVPVICKSTDGGNTFTSCVQAFGTTANPGGTGTQLTNCLENTIPARSMIADPVDGSLDFMYSCSTLGENLAHPPYGPLHNYYLAKSLNGVTFTTHTIFIAPTSGGQNPNLANIFGNIAEDSAGNYYAMWVGSLNDSEILDSQNHFHVYLTTSTDHGATWSSPVAVDTLSGGDGLGTHTLVHFAVTSPGNIDVVWYGTKGVGEPNGLCGSTGQTHPCKDGTRNVGMDHESNSSSNCGTKPTPCNDAGPVPGNWKVYMAQSTNALSTNPTFTFNLVDPKYRHFGTICTNGIVCSPGNDPSDRHLLDFISVVVDCGGLAHVAYAVDQSWAGTAPPIGSANRLDGSLQTIVTNQTGGQTLAPPPGCEPSTNIAEVPYAPFLPVGGAAAIALTAVLRRRRNASSAARGGQAGE